MILKLGYMLRVEVRVYVQSSNKNRRIKILISHGRLEVVLGLGLDCLPLTQGGTSNL